MLRPRPSLLILALCAGCGAAPQAPRLERPSIVLVTVDTLRREHLGCYGYPRDTSPVIDALAEESVVFDRALATMATTLPSHLSMLTGLYAHQHGRTSNKDGALNPFRSGPQVASLARVLADDGYRTAAFVSSRVLDQRTGLGDGFADYWCPQPEGNPARSDVTTGKALQWLDELERAGDTGDPLFLWLHLWDTHEPNEPPADLAERFRRDAVVDAWVAERGMDPTFLTEKFREHDRIWAHFLGQPMPAEGEAPSEPRVIDLARLGDLVARYDADLFHVDRELGRFVERLRELGILERSILVFTSDHGQSLGEHDVFGHGKILNVNTFVPLLVRFPPTLRTGSDAVGRPRRVDDVVSLIDLVPTLLARTPDDFLADFRHQLQGQDVLDPAFDRGHALTQEATSFRRREGSALKVALVTERWKYLHDREAQDELYDLEGEGEGVDVRAQHPEVAARLEALVRELVAQGAEVSSGEAAPAEEVDQLLEDLRALGYVDDEDG